MLKRLDRVHYPLPLTYEDSPNVDHLRRTVARLRKQLLEAKAKPAPDTDIS
jgi:hypothetical protein